MKKHLTPEQTAARDAKRAKFKTLWKQVSAMTPEARIKLAMQLGIVTVDGHPLSTGNSILCMKQIPGVSVVGGFRQWLKHGRAVMKGQHGASIWVPTGGRKNDVPLDGNSVPSAVADGQPTSSSDHRFIVGTVFDLSQTSELADVVDPYGRITGETTHHTELEPAPE